MIAITLVTLLAFCLSSCDGHVAKDEIEPSHRKLGYYKYTCEDYIDLNDRCCGDDLSACKCPIRNWSWFEYKWECKCKKLTAYVEECSEPELLNIVASAIELGSFSTLVAAVTAADLADVLSSADARYTVFAPTDAAFSNLPDGLVQCLLKEENKEILSSILLYHVVDGVAASSGLSDGQVIETLNGESVTVDLTDGVKINDSVVSQPDFMASNGIIHVIDSVLVPSSVDVAAFLAEC